MGFNSGGFVVFFLGVSLLYILTRRSLRWQNGLLLVASYTFYSFWDWRFLSLIIISTLIDYRIGRRLMAEPGCAGGSRHRKLLLFCSVGANLAILGFFKYFNFFADGATQLLNLLGMQADGPTLRIILPVGISFYTFQTMSYTIDVYRRKIAAADSLLDFAVYVAFFPQLVAGPIERATRLLPQIQNPRNVTAADVETGLFLVLWGYCKKVVIADHMAMIVTSVFDDPVKHAGLDIYLATFAFAVQIYCDFSGYSDIARGLARLLGIKLMVNFRLPYFARNPSDFWQRWHISLSSWLRDYLYIPLGGNRRGSLITLRNLMLTMLLGGLWHGAAWSFVFWGGYHGVLLCLYRLLSTTSLKNNLLKPNPGPVLWLLQVGVMFHLTCLGWIFFRAESPARAWDLIGRFSPGPTGSTNRFLQDLILLALPLILVQFYQHLKCDLLALLRLSQPVRGLLYGLMLAAIMTLGVRKTVEFIYFQF